MYIHLCSCMHMHACAYLVPHIQMAGRDCSHPLQSVALRVRCMAQIFNSLLRLFIIKPPFTNVLRN